MASVLEIQRALIARGYDLGPAGADGVKGRATIAAIRKFQADHRLKVDGIVGPGTGAILFAGAADKPATAAEVKSDDRTLSDPAQLPWCGDAIETAIANTLPDEILPVNPYWAQNWATFGVQVEPTLGAALSFERPGGGHVGLYVAEDSRAFHVLGGNQSDRVTVCRIEKDRLVGCRWPKTAPLPTTGRIVRATGDLTLSVNEA